MHRKLPRRKIKVEISKSCLLMTRLFWKKMNQPIATWCESLTRQLNSRELTLATLSLTKRQLRRTAQSKPSWKFFRQKIKVLEVKLWKQHPSSLSKDIGSVFGWDESNRKVVLRKKTLENNITIENFCCFSYTRCNISQQRFNRFCIGSRKKRH